MSLFQYIFKEMIMRKFVLLFCLLVLSLTLVSCAPSKDGNDIVTVRMWMMPNSLEPVIDIKEVLTPFEEANPKIKVEVTLLDWGAAWTKITTAATSQDTPDIVQLGSTWVGSISGMGALWDMNDKVGELGGAAAFVPAAWATSGIIGSGKVTSIPWIVDARALYYRTDVLKAAGLTPKDLATWDSFKASLTKIKDAKLTIEGLEIAPLGMPGKNDWNVVHNLSPWIWGAGGDFLSKDMKASVLNSTQALKGVSFYISLVKAGLVPAEFLELNTAQVSSNFNNGSVAMYFDGPYEVRTLTTPPAQGGAADSITARNFGVLDYPKACGFLPAYKKVFDNPYFSVSPARKVFKEAIIYGKTYPCIPSWGMLEPILTRRFGILWDYVTGSGENVDMGDIQKQLDLGKREVESVLNQGE